MAPTPVASNPPSSHFPPPTSSTPAAKPEQTPAPPTINTDEMVKKLRNELNDDLTSTLREFQEKQKKENEPLIAKPSPTTFSNSSSSSKHFTLYNPMHQQILLITQLRPNKLNQKLHHPLHLHVHPFVAIVLVPFPVIHKASIQDPFCRQTGYLCASKPSNSITG